MRLIALCVFLVALPAVASAQEPPRRMAVLVLGSGGLSQETADGLTEVLIGALVGRGGVEVVGKEEFQAQLGTDEQASQTCLDSPSCLGRVGVQLGVDEVVAGSVGPRRGGGGFTMSLNRIEISTTHVIGRVFKQVDGDEQALARAVQAAATELYAAPAAPEVGGLRVTSNVEGADVFVDGEKKGVTPLALRGLPVGRHAVRVEHDGYVAWSGDVEVRAGHREAVEAHLEGSAGADEGGASGAAIAVTIAGAAIAIGGGVVGYLFATSSQETMAKPSGITQVEAQRRYDAYYDDRESDALIANVSFGVGGAALLFTTYMLVFQSDAVFGGSEHASLGVRPLAEGGAEGTAVIRW